MQHFHVSEESGRLGEPGGTLPQRGSHGGGSATSQITASSQSVYTRLSTEASSFLERQQRASPQESFLKLQHFGTDQTLRSRRLERAGEGCECAEAPLILLAEEVTSL